MIRVITESRRSEIFRKLKSRSLSGFIFCWNSLVSTTLIVIFIVVIIRVIIIVIVVVIFAVFLLKTTA